MLRRLDHFLDLIGRPEERRQTDDDTDDDGQQIAARGLRGAVAHAGEEHDQGDCNQAGPARADVGEDHAQTGQLGAFAGIGRQNAVQRAEGHITTGGENGDQQVGDPHVDHLEGVAPGSLHGEQGDDGKGHGQRAPAHPRLVLAFALIDRAVGHGADDRVVDAVKDADKERQKRDGSGGNSHLVCQEHRHKGADPVVDGVVAELGDGVVYSLPERQLDVRGKFRLLFDVGHCFLSFFLF